MGTLTARPAAKTFLNRILAFLFPPRCHFCGKRLAEDQISSGYSYCSAYCQNEDSEEQIY
jgi:hypothetical protein